MAAISPQAKLGVNLITGHTEEPRNEKPTEEDELQPEINSRPLPDSVRRERARMAEVDARDRALYETAIEKHLVARTVALDALEAQLDRLAEETDLDLIGDTRPAAVWQMAGRCIGIGRLMLDALAMGYTAELPHLARALHEADRLLAAFEYPSEEPLLRKWLADDGHEWVRPKEAREALARIEQMIRDGTGVAGEEAINSIEQLNMTIYDQHSRAAHHRRSWVQDAVFPDERKMIRGISDAWIRRAMTTHSMVKVVDESIIFVGSALANFFDTGWYSANVMPLMNSLDSLHEVFVLPE